MLNCRSKTFHLIYEQQKVQQRLCLNKNSRRHSAQETVAASDFSCYIC